MFRNILIRLGLLAAPSPVRKYAIASSFFGVLPVAAWAAWRNRSQLASLAHRLPHLSQRTARTQTASAL